MKNIVLSEKIKNGKEKYDAVISNIEIVNEFHYHSLSDEDIHYDSLCSYFVDALDEIVSFEGVKAFLFNTRISASIKKYIRDGLRMLYLPKHEQVFEEYLELISIYDNKDIYDLEGNVGVSFHELDEKYRELDSKKLELRNAEFLLNHPDVLFLSKQEREIYINDYIKSLSREEYQSRLKNAHDKQPQYKNDVLYLCNFLNEELDMVYNASISLFQYENNLHIYFRTCENNQYCYIDLGFEIVLLNNQNEEIRRFSRLNMA
ncbi:MAG: hypothetical protein LBT75_01375 [Bacilli bacterium]|jgi:hypothetical protein|nr:hypothetical protein [Bacilli bacterium]